MPQGRHPQPQGVKEAKGSQSKSKGQMPVGDAPTNKHGAPDSLKGAALTIWNDLAPDLKSMQFLRDTDRQAFARYCVHLSKWWELNADIEEKGVSYETKSRHGDMMRVNPSFLVRERIEKHLIALEDRFGMNPAYRQQILQRMAGLIAAPIGDLFAGETGNPDDIDNAGAEQRVPSAIGLLNATSKTVN